MRVLVSASCCRSRAVSIGVTDMQRGEPRVRRARREPSPEERTVAGMVALPVPVVALGEASRAGVLASEKAAKPAARLPPREVEAQAPVELAPVEPGARQMAMGAILRLQAAMQGPERVARREAAGRTVAHRAAVLRWAATPAPDPTSLKSPSEISTFAR